MKLTSQCNHHSLTNESCAIRQLKRLGKNVGPVNDLKYNIKEYYYLKDLCIVSKEYKWKHEPRIDQYHKFSSYVDNTCDYTDLCVINKETCECIDRVLTITKRSSVSVCKCQTTSVSESIRRDYSSLIIVCIVSSGRIVRVLTMVKRGGLL